MALLDMLIVLIITWPMTNADASAFANTDKGRAMDLSITFESGKGGADHCLGFLFNANCVAIDLEQAEYRKGTDL